MDVNIFSEVLVLPSGIGEVCNLKHEEKKKNDFIGSPTDVDPVLGLVIVDYMSWEHTREAILSALKSFQNFAKIIVVDNGIAIADDAVELEGSIIHILHPSTNQGFAAGVNLGLEALQNAGATHCVILNPDARMLPDTVSKLFEAMTTDPRIGIAAPVSYNDAECQKIEFAGAKRQLYIGRLPHCVKLEKDSPAVSDQPFVTGCCWLLNMAVFESVGPLPEAYFLYFEDTDYCQSVQFFGFRTVLAKEAKVVHLGSRIVGRHSPTYRYYFARNRIWFMRRWARADQMLTFLSFTLLVKLPAAIALFGARDRDLPALAAFFRGTWDGLIRPISSVHSGRTK